MRRELDFVVGLWRMGQEMDGLKMNDLKKSSYCRDDLGRRWWRRRELGFVVEVWRMGQEMDGLKMNDLNVY